MWRPTTSSIPIWLFILSQALGCANGPSDDACEASAGDIADPAPTEMRIPVVPRDTHTIEWINRVEQGPDGTRSLEVSHTITLALGEDYSDALTVSFGELWYLDCGRLIGSLVMENASADGPELAVDVVDGLLALQFFEEGEARITAQGSLSLEDVIGCAESYAPFEIVDVALTLSVRVRRPAGVVFEVPSMCRDADRPHVESGARWSSFKAYVVDADGDAFNPANAETGSQVALTAKGDDVTFELPEPALDALIVRGLAGAVQLESDFGDTLAVELVGPGAIDAMEVSFHLVGAGGGGRRLVDGGTYGENRFGRTSNVIAPNVTAMYVGSVPLCTGPRPEAFTLASRTPETCRVWAPAPAGDLRTDDVGPLYVGSAGLVQAAGNCRLRVEAPAFDDCRGLAQDLSVTLLTTDGLSDGMTGLPLSEP